MSDVRCQMSDARCQMLDEEGGWNWDGDGLELGGWGLTGG